MTSPASTALILSGGGARAAYQVGVLKAIGNWQGRGRGLPFQILSGTSAGAVNATVLAAWASCLCKGVRQLEGVWSQFNTGQVFYADAGHIMKHLTKRLLHFFQADYAGQLPPSLLDPTPLQQLLANRIPFARVDQQIRLGRLRALAVTASSYSLRTSVSFFTATDDCHPWHRAKRLGIRTHLSEAHLLASTSLPFLFPPVRIKHQYFADGTIHQLSPLSPVIHLGAERILVVGTQHHHPPPPQARHHPPTAGTIAGHLLDTIFTDALNADLERAWRINQTLEQVPPRRLKHMALRPLNIMVIQPSQNLDALAARFYQHLPRAVRWLLSRMGVSDDAESSLLSYLLFESPYCRELIALGEADAEAQKAALAPHLGILA
ncbi:patatin-like phospholipase family protein [Gallaecimonas kandeliae]|uniref:patatin-like phospholipase family protein n=1 Tax=Gallaecimonas kandeliae TaxID=3029055 RepID=UPI0026489E1E|nr:patatin-like phospholipase family protein [Gallaecimonas kandeliae]WKE64509.1 patatin-like phospholipase family protein [Gallaecimonas kandeliae]